MPIKPFEESKKQSEIIEFRVRNMDAPKEVWQPSRDSSSVDRKGESSQLDLSSLVVN